MEKWNQIVELFNKNINAAEDIVQNIWEKIFAEIFGYSSLAGEIEGQRSIRIGSTERLTADIIIRNGDTDSFIVELKKHNRPIDRKMEMQLLSYLKQLQNSTGILICNKIYIFAYDYSKRDDEQNKAEIEFKQGNPDGVKFIEMFSKATFDERIIKEFVLQKIEFAKSVGRIINDLTAELAIDLLRNYFTEKYGASEFEQAINSFNITVTPKITRIDNPATSSEHIPAPVVLEGNRLGRGELKKLCASNGIYIGKFNYANRYVHRNTYNVDPPIERVTRDWWLLLNDPLKKELHVFEVPRNSISANELKIRADKPSDFLMRFKCDDGSFEELNSKIKFDQWLVKTIKY